MSIRKSDKPYGYRDLLVYKKAEELQRACAAYTARFPREKTLVALADQMDRSARSVKQNIVEGWKRNSTKEYYDFLGFSLGANAELEEDCNDIIGGVYAMGGRGLMGETGYEIKGVERLPFFPLDMCLPPLIQLKLRCKEMNLLLQRLQKSLLAKMETEHGLSQREMLNRSTHVEKEKDMWLDREIEAQGLVRLPNGQVIPKGEKRE